MIVSFYVNLLGVALVDESVTVFGKIFPRAANKHKFQMIQHFKVVFRGAGGEAPQKTFLSFT